MTYLFYFESAQFCSDLPTIIVKCILNLIKTILFWCQKLFSKQFCFGKNIKNIKTSYLNSLNEFETKIKNQNKFVLVETNFKLCKIVYNSCGELLEINGDHLFILKISCFSTRFLVEKKSIRCVKIQNLDFLTFFFQAQFRNVCFLPTLLLVLCD